MTQYNFKSSDMVYAPGIIRLAQSLYSDKNDKNRTLARDVVRCWDGIPEEDIEAIISGNITTELVGETLVVTINQEIPKFSI